MKTPTACCANTLLKAPTCRSSRPTTSTTSQPNSTIDPAKHSAGKHPPKPSTNYCPTRPNHPLLHPPPQTPRRVAGFYVCSPRLSVPLTRLADVLIGSHV